MYKDCKWEFLALMAIADEIHSSVLSKRVHGKLVFGLPFFDTEGKTPSKTIMGRLRK